MIDYVKYEVHPEIAAAFPPQPEPEVEQVQAPVEEAQVLGQVIE